MDDPNTIENSNRRGHESIAALALSVLAHATALIALALFSPSVPRPTHSYVLAYLIEADAPGGSRARIGKGSGVRFASGQKNATSAAGRPHTARRSEASGTKEEPAGTPALLTENGTAQSAVSTQIADPGDASGSPSRAGKGSGLRLDGTGPGVGAGGTDDGGGDGIGFGGAHARYGQSPAPDYPEQARRDGWQGTVVLRVMLSADGAVESVEVAKSSGYGLLDRAAMKTVRTRWRFEPAERDGVKVASWVMVPIRFALKESRAEWRE